MAVKKMAILRLTPEALIALLQLPPEAEVVRVELSTGQRGVLHLMIEGAGWNTPDGGMVQPALTPIVTEARDAQGALVRWAVDWGLPAAEGGAEG